MISEETARAFIVRTLNDVQIHELRELESRLPLPTLYFTSWQIAKHFQSRRPEVAPEEIDAMDKLWLEFYSKTLYPQQQAEEKIHSTGCTMTTCHHPFDDRCKTKAQEMWQWEDFVIRHYEPPQVHGRGVTASIMASVLLLVSVWH